MAATFEADEEVWHCPCVFVGVLVSGPTQSQDIRIADVLRVIGISIGRLVEVSKAGQALNADLTCKHPLPHCKCPD